MKRTVTLLFLTICVFFAACNKDNETNDESLINSQSIAVSETESSDIREIILDKDIKMTIARTLPSCLAFENDKFYAYDENGDLYRIFYDGDMSVLSEGLDIYVKMTDIKKVEANNGTGWSPKFEATASYVGLIARPYN